uniref:Uncharacterized protein n=1 Tax=Macaca mulatta TaxID=9544 RepID=A0A5F7Z7V0_MACMU
MSRNYASLKHGNVIYMDVHYCIFYMGPAPTRRATGTAARAHALSQQARSPRCHTRPRQSPGARTPDPELGLCGAQLGAATPRAENPARSGEPVARRALSPQAAASHRSLLAAEPGPTGAQLSSRQRRGSLNNGAPGRGRRAASARVPRSGSSSDQGAAAGAGLRPGNTPCRCTRTRPPPPAEPGA